MIPSINPIQTAKLNHQSEESILDIGLVFDLFKQKKGAPPTKEENDVLWQIIEIASGYTAEEQTSEQAIINAMLTVHHPDVEMIALFLEKHPELVHCKNNRGGNLLLYALGNATLSEEVLQLLIKSGAKPLKDNVGLCPFMSALLHANPQILEIILAPLNKEERKRTLNELLEKVVVLTPFYPIVEKLLNMGAVIPADVKRGYGIVFAALQKGMPADLFACLFSTLDLSTQREVLHYSSPNECCLLKYMSYLNLSAETWHILLERAAPIEGSITFKWAVLTFALTAKNFDGELFPSLYQTIMSSVSDDERKKILAIDYPDDPTFGGQTLLHTAVIRGMSPNFLKRMIEDGASIVIQDGAGKTPLHYAALDPDKEELLATLLDQEEESKQVVNLEDKAGETVATYATYSEMSPNLMKKLGERGAASNIYRLKGPKQWTPLHAAVLIGAPLKVYDDLLNKYPLSRQEIIINSRDATGLTPLQYACKRDQSFEIIHYLLSKGAYPEDLGNDWHPLERALLTGAPKRAIKEILDGLDKEAQLDLLNRTYLHDAYTALHMAVLCNCDPEIIRLLISYGAKNLRDPDKKRSPLHLVAPQAKNAAAIYRALLQGLSPSERERILQLKEVDKYTVLHIALAWGASKEVIDILFTSGALTIRNKEGKNPLFYINPESPDAYDLYLNLLSRMDPEERRMILNQREKVTKGTLLHSVVARNGGKVSARIIELFISFGARLKEDHFNATPLHYIDMRSPQAQQCVRILLSIYSPERQIDKLNIANKYGETVLLLAIANNATLSFIRYLLESGAHPEIVTKRGKSSFEYAIIHPNEVEVCGLLLKHAKTPESRKRMIMAREPSTNCTLFQLAIFKKTTPEALYHLMLQELSREESEEILNAENSAKQNLLFSVLACNPAPTLVKLFIRAGANPEQLHTDPKTEITVSLLHLALGANFSKEVIELLLTEVSNKNRASLIGSNGKKSCLGIALEKGGNPEILNLLLQAGAKIDEEMMIIKKDKPIKTSLLHIATHATPSLTLRSWETLLNAIPFDMRKELLNRQDEEGDTVLHSSAIDSSVISLLIQYGASPNLKNMDGKTPLDLAYQAGRYDLAEQLLICGATPRSISLYEIQRLAEDLKKGWSKFTYTTDLDQRVLECYCENKNATTEATVVILQAKEDGNQALSLYLDNFNYKFENLVTLSKYYRYTTLKVVSSTKEAISFLSKEGTPLDTLYLELHGPGAELENPSSLHWFGKKYLRIGNQKWIDTLQKREPHKIIVYSCGSARKEKEGETNPFEEMAQKIPGVTMIGSDDSFNGMNCILSPGSLLETQFFDSTRQRNLTVLLQGQTRTKIS